MIDDRFVICEMKSQGRLPVVACCGTVGLWMGAERHSGRSCSCSDLITRRWDWKGVLRPRRPNLVSRDVVVCIFGTTFS